VVGQQNVSRDNRKAVRLKKWNHTRQGGTWSTGYEEWVLMHGGLTGSLTGSFILSIKSVPL
jgi:hypothetical protein